MTRKDFVEKLLKSGRSDEEIAKALEKGSEKDGLKPMDKRFSKLQVQKIKKSLKK